MISSFNLPNFKLPNFQEWNAGLNHAERPWIHAEKDNLAFARAVYSSSGSRA